VVRYEGKSHLEDLGVDRKILKLIFRRWNREMWTVLLWLRIGGNTLTGEYRSACGKSTLHNFVYRKSHAYCFVTESGLPQ
jgi:hypothetical protein